MEMLTFKQFFLEKKTKRDRCLRRADSVYGKRHLHTNPALLSNVDKAKSGKRNEL
jgi:hypothetical protein